MTMQHFIKTGALLVLLYIFSGCKSNPTSVVYTNDGKPGTIVGQVTLIDSLYKLNEGYTILSDASGVEVSIDGTQLKGITDANGRFSIENIPPGAYWLIFKKDGFATYHEGVIDFPGNGTDYHNGQLNRLSYITPELILRAFDSNGIATFTFKVLDSLQLFVQAQGYIFFGKTDAITPSDPNSYVFSAPVTYEPNYISGDYSFSRTSFTNSGFSPGDKIYCVVYAGKNSAAVSYLDLQSFKRIYTGFSPYTSGVKNFILPP